MQHHSDEIVSKQQLVYEHIPEQSWYFSSQNDGTWARCQDQEPQELLTG